ncbi:MAG: hypothetical protein HN704_03850 [Bacteroidetes bacterium]|jgi:hypothetical protein|nr:hypothetical protein [Bacteroidota bacterium]MBT7142508.1 hypothetical protein [Bacteroidota bacterium]MBT7490726.1 hypothetical protein [Bacteroidota bacterium]
MIVKWFISHQIKESMRSSIWQKSVVLNIVIGFLLLLMLAYLALLGLFIDVILIEIFPEKDPIALFNGILIYYLGIELLLRYFMQSLPTLNIETYLHLPIKKSKIVHFVASKSIVAIGNYLALLVFFPFAFKVIAPAYSSQIAWIWIISMILLIFSNNFLATFIKRQMANKPKIVGYFGLVILVLFLFDYFQIISLSTFSTAIFAELLKSPLYIMVPVLLLILTYYLNYNFLKSRLYPEEVSVKKKLRTDSISDIKYLKTMGLTGQLIMLELRLLWRHKRTRSIIYMAPIFLGYGFFFYPNPVYRDMAGFLIFVGIFMTGGMMLNYTNYCFSYESNYFDNILANYKDINLYIRVKYIIAISISTICYILTIPYVFFGTDIFLINTMTYFYNIGFLSIVLFYFATFSKKRMDLSKNAAFNYQGLGASHWLSMLPAFLLPVFIYLPFSFFDLQNTGFIFIGALGLGGLLFYKSMLNFILKQFYKNKYKMAEGFRE